MEKVVKYDEEVPNDDGDDEAEEELQDLVEGKLRRRSSIKAWGRGESYIN